MERYNVTGFPVVDGAGRVVGIVTNRDMRFATDDATPVRVMMTATTSRCCTSRSTARRRSR